ncbi:PREDICTED: odorant receptor Or2-like [Trachymyrmex septentrionalis]|uniref:odorant receptor Or2-like n=1 Tax=Trachymyrmex septentrionalis TaxID=34720 RepID=UPI00084F7C01|nr:PREDICTED: odorant receptor Or2-like [Trachymyrmex septentrionalis]
MLHTLAASYIGLIAMIATGTMLLAYLQHTCGMFSIASYRIEQAINILQKDDLKNKSKIYKEIIYAVDIHRRAMEFTDFLISNFEGSFFFLIAIGVTCLSLNLLQAALYRNNIEQLILPLLIIMILYVYLFVSNWTAQEITDHNEYIFATVYNVQWYVAPLHIQKMMLFLLQRGAKAFHMILGGIFVASLESAAALMSTSISYFTVLYSTKN